MIEPVISGDAPLLRFDAVSKIYGQGGGQVVALDKVELSIEAGEFVAIMGHSGSGKSTAMNILGCLDTPSSGRFLFSGFDASKLSRDGRALLRRNYLGFVFQGFNLLRRTTALENVELPLIYKGMRRAERQQLAAKALAQVGLAGRERHSPAELSGGQQQRVAIARAIVTEPLVLLADEPTGNLDSQRSVEIMELLRLLNTEHRITIVMVTHEPDMADFASRVLRFHDGQIAADNRRQTS